MLGWKSIGQLSTRVLQSCPSAGLALLGVWPRCELSHLCKMAENGALPRFFLLLLDTSFVALMSWISAEKGQQRRVSLGLEPGPWVSIPLVLGRPCTQAYTPSSPGTPIQQVHFAVYCFFSFLSQPIKYSHLPFLFSVISWPVFS